MKNKILNFSLWICLVFSSIHWAIADGTQIDSLAPTKVATRNAWQKTGKAVDAESENISFSTRAQLHQEAIDAHQKAINKLSESPDDSTSERIRLHQQTIEEHKAAKNNNLSKAANLTDEISTKALAESATAFALNTKVSHKKAIKANNDALTQIAKMPKNKANQEKAEIHSLLLSQHKEATK